MPSATFRFTSLLIAVLALSPQPALAFHVQDDTAPLHWAADPPLPPDPPPTPPPPPPPPRFPDLPVNEAIPVFIPSTGYRAAAAVPSWNYGYNPQVTLTFDDCGSPQQMQDIVETLKASGRSGIFFVTGQCRDHYPWLVGRLIAEGQLVCNHTYSHPDLRRLSDAAIAAEIGGGVMTGCPYFRPPYGAWDGPRGRIATIAARFGLTTMLWDVDSRDWAGASAPAMASAVRARGGVVLFHLHGWHTAEAIKLLG